MHLHDLEILTSHEQVEEFKYVPFRKSSFSNVQLHSLFRSAVSHIRADVDPYICDFGSSEYLPPAVVIGNIAGIE